MNTQEFVSATENQNLWPIDVSVHRPICDGIRSGQHQAIVGAYADGSRKVLGINGNRYQATTAQQWRDLVRATIEAGAEPVFGHAWAGKVLAVFDVFDRAGIKSHLCLADSFDGSIPLTLGQRTFRPKCANQLSAKNRGLSMARINHTQSLTRKVEALKVGIDRCVEEGQRMADIYQRARDTVLTEGQATNLFDRLFPIDGLNGKAKTRVENLREDALQAMADPVNNEGQTIASIWNSATFIVDRYGDGSQRKRKGDRYERFLFGSAAKRTNEILGLVEVFMADGSIEAMTVPQATEAGVDKQQIGAALLESMLN